MEQKRINAKLTNIEQNLYLLSQKINGIPLAFIFNLDRIGYEEFTNTHEITILVLANYQKATASYYSASSNQTQMLDLVTFHSHKTNLRKARLFVIDDDNLLIDKIQLLLDSFQKSDTFLNI